MDGRWLVLGGLFLGRMCMGLQLQAVAALAEPLRAELGFSYTQIGLLIGLFLLPGVIVAFPATLLGRRFGERRLGPAAVLLMASGSGIGIFATDFATAAAGRLVAGTGGILLNIFFTRLVADLFLGYRLNLALALLMSSWPLGLALATVTFPLAAAAFGWRDTFAALTLFTAVAGLLIAGLLRLPGSGKAGRGSAAAGLLRLDLSRRELGLSLLAGFAWATFSAAGVVYLSFAPPFLIQQGASLTGASFVTSFIVWGGLVAIPLGGWLADRYGGTLPLILLSTLACTLCLLLVPLGGPALALTVLLGIAWGLPPGPYMSILQAAVTPAARSAAYGVYFTLFYGGIGALPALAGLLLDVTGAPATPLYFAAALMAASLPALLAFRRWSRAGPAPAPV